MVETGRLRTDLFALAVLALAVFLGLSLVSFDPADPPAHAIYPLHTQVANLCGEIGAWLSHELFARFGHGAYFVLLSLIVFDLRLFSRENMADPLVRLCGAGMLLVAVCVTLQLLPMPLPQASLVGSGGEVGAWGTILLDRHFSKVGTLVLVGSFGLAGLLLTGEVRLIGQCFRIVLLPITIWGDLAFAKKGKEKPAAKAIAKSPATGTAAPASETLKSDEPSENLSKPQTASVSIPVPGFVVEEDVAETEEDDAALLENRPFIKVNPPVGSGPKTPRPAAVQSPPSPADSALPFQLPDASMLADAEEFPYELLAQKAQTMAAKIEKTFKEFSLNVKVVEIDTGPVITQFELELEAGLRLSKVTSLADDLAIALRVPAVRVVAPIPGKNTVGVEVPNDVRVMVRLKELIETCQKDFEGKHIPLFLGKDVSGKPLVVDLAKMPHLLIAGRTGTGKSVCLNTLILSMLMSRDPKHVKMLMIDPKMVELSPYMRIPHLMHPVITDMKKAEAVLGWAVDKMEERYDLLARVGVRHLDGYNKLGKEKVLQRLGISSDDEEADRIPEHMPYIVIIADEMADMMMTSGKDVEGHIIRLAQKSRAVGIHLVLATQKPTVDVITGLIKSNLPSRIAFQVSSRTDSRVVLDEMGAEKLLGNGDMLYLAPGTSNLIRAQGTYVSDEEVNGIIEFFADQPPQYSAEIQQVTTTAKTSGKSEPRVKDELYEQACEVVIREGRGSVSLLQRALGVGYGRGARMIDWMAEDGIVGSYNGSQAREVILTMEQWEERKEAGELAAV